MGKILHLTPVIKCPICITSEKRVFSIKNNVFSQYMNIQTDGPNIQRLALCKLNMSGQWHVYLLFEQGPYIYEIDYMVIRWYLLSNGFKT